VQVDGLVNATSVGMRPIENASLVPANILGNFPVVMDIVYDPLETRLLREAKSAGCEVINGLSMLLHQGVAQFEAWTGQDAPVEVMRTALMNMITE
jgi:shikimate dehydrogenase